METPPPAPATAYLVAWTDARGRIVDAGIYSEASPTVGRLSSGLRTHVQLEARSRFPAMQGGYARAAARMEQVVETQPQWRWVRSCRTYASQRLSGRRMGL